MSFRPILAGLAARRPSVRAIAFCDEEGERVEAFIQDQSVDAYTVDILGASVAPIVPALFNQGAGAHVRMAQADGVVWVKLVTDRYYIVVLAHRTPALAAIADDLDDVAIALHAHM